MLPSCLVATYTLRGISLARYAICTLTLISSLVIRYLSVFICLLCFCPLYLMDDCGGKYSHIRGIKDCSECMIPHAPKGYDYICDKFRVHNA